MFSYLRYFAVISLLLVFIGAVGLGLYFRQVKSAELHDFIHSQNEAIVASYTETIWQQYFNSAKDKAAQATFKMDSDRFFRNFPLVTAKIVSPNHTATYYYLNDRKMTRDGVTMLMLPDVYYQKNPPLGLAVTELLKKTYIVDGTASGPARVVMQSVVPILTTTNAEIRNGCVAGTRTSGCVAVAQVELFVDVTKNWKQLVFQQYLMTGVIVGSFIVLVGILILMANRAEAIIARQHEVNLELTAAAAQAEAQSRDKSQFLASVSHELRTPLNAIIGFSEIIKNEARTQMQKVYQEYVDDIYASGKHLLSLINDILDYSKAEAGKLPLFKITGARNETHIPTEQADS